jgi:hypothetical protein
LPGSATKTLPEIDVTPNPFNFGSSVQEHTTLNVAAPGALTNFFEPNDSDEKVAITFVDSSLYAPGTPIALPSGATVTLILNGSFTYQAASGFTGIDAFTFKVADADAANNCCSCWPTTGTVSIGVFAPAPVVPH